jgi:hypothetical protein
MIELDPAPLAHQQRLKQLSCLFANGKTKLRQKIPHNAGWRCLKIVMSMKKRQLSLIKDDKEAGFAADNS